MLVLAVIALTQLVVLVMVLAVVVGPADREPASIPSERIRDLEQQTIEAMVAEAREHDVIDSYGRDQYPRP